MENEKRVHPDTIKHLEFIQGAINRMAANSFQMKGWTITIFSALLALFAASSTKDISYLFVALVPALIFWFLDAYYLQQERKFRGIYNDVAGITTNAKRNEVQLFDMPLGKYKGGRYSYWNVLLSRTVCPLYIIMIISALLVMIAMQYD